MELVKGKRRERKQSRGWWGDAELKECRFHAGRTWARLYRLVGGKEPRKAVVRGDQPLFRSKPKSNTKSS